MKPFDGTGRILLMDDEEHVRQTTGDVLKRLGYSVVFADDGLRTIDLYHEARKAEAPFDAVIMDLNIPGGMGGTRQ
jgi:CheY-like chemotaxis protein